jgi:glycine cleavage system H lipoate-binding protein
MGGVLFGLVVVIAFTLYHFLVERPRRRALEREGPCSVPLPLAEIIGNLPDGVFLHPTLTWGRLLPEGDVELGIHPLLLGLVGRHSEIKPRGVPGRVEKGDPIASIVAGDHEFVIRSPAKGWVVATNPRARSDPSWVETIREDGWVCRIRPDRLSAEIGDWMIADEALEWTKRKYVEIRDGILGLTPHGGSQLLLADGGEIPIGVLTQLDAEACEQFERGFLVSSS